MALLCILSIALPIFSSVTAHYIPEVPHSAWSSPASHPGSWQEWHPPPPPPPPSPPSLFAALEAAGATKFAALIQSNPNISAIYLSDQVQTVFAPTDAYIDDAMVRLAKRQSSLTPAQEQQLLLHADQQQSDIDTLDTPPGKVVTTKDSTANLKGNTQKVVSKPKSNSTSSKRSTDSLQPRQGDTSPTTLVDLYAGLGNSIGILTGDIVYAGGLIQTTDGLFTLPESVSDTAQATGQTTFVNLAECSGQSSVIDSTPLITVFVPTNDAFAAAGTESLPMTEVACILQGHVVPNFAGYLPSLVNGSTLTTLAGTNLTVTIQGDDYYIDDALIVSSNLITENGVSHVINQVLSM